MKNTIKFGIIVGIWLGIMIGVSVANNFIMLNLHDFMYYYTWDGLKQMLKIIMTESMILIPGSIIYFKSFMNKEMIRQYVLEQCNEEEEP